MKLDERRIADVVRHRPGYRVVLLHGDDPVRVAACARSVLQAAGNTAQTFAAASELSGPEHSRAEAALNAPLLGEEAPVVRLRDATDAAAPSIEAILERAPAGMLVVEAGSLTARSRLRVLVETSAAGAAVHCRSNDNRATAAAVDEVFLSYGVAVNPEARNLLLQRSATQQSAVHDAEKLALLIAGAGQLVGKDEILALEDGREATSEALLFAAAAGDGRKADRLVEVLLAGGAAPTAVVRGLLVLLARARGARSRGAGAGLASSESNFGRLAEIGTALAACTADEFDTQCAALWAADRACRVAGAPAGVICSRAVHNLARCFDPNVQGRSGR